MTLLRSDLLATGTYTLRVTGIAMTAGAIALAALPKRGPQVVPVPVPEIDVSAATSNVAVRGVESEEPAPPPRAGLPHAELAFVFRAGGQTYMKLDDLDSDHLPKHGKAHVFKEDYLDVATAPVRAPEDERAWLGRTVVVDNNCTAKVTGFAIVARANGEAGWADPKMKQWTAAALFEHGAPVLAATLDDCDGTYARDAKLPAMAIPQVGNAGVFAAKAKTMLRESQTGRDADREWQDSWGEKNHWWESKEIDVTATALKHPKTGEIFISIRAYKEHGCGDPYVDLWGLYRVGKGGALEKVQERKLESIDDIIGLVDIDNDGQFEVIGREWLGDTALETLDGEQLEHIGVQFFGCPC